MAASMLIGLVDATFNYFQSLGDWHKDPVGLEAVRVMRDRMVVDLESLSDQPTSAELAELCRQWRGMRIEIDGEATYPPDMFIESVCQIIEIS